MQHLSFKNKEQEGIPWCSEIQNKIKIELGKTFNLHSNLHSVAARRRGSSTLIWWKKEIQERPRGMKASLKLRLSLLIHIETFKEVNSAIGNLVEWFLSLKHILWKFASLSRLFYSRKGWQRLLCFAACVCMVLNAYPRSKPLYTYACTCAHGL